jgi:hypothetical protein
MFSHFPFGCAASTFHAAAAAAAAALPAAHRCRAAAATDAFVHQGFG